MDPYANGFRVLRRFYFQANNISKADAQVIGELFSTELVAARFYDVVDRKNIEKLLSEQEFQLSDCTESSCAVKIGRILTLDSMIYGSVSKLGDTFIVNVQLVNVATAQIENSTKEKFAKIDEAIDILKKVVYQLAGRELPEEKGTRQPAAVKSEVARAAVPSGPVPAPARSFFFDIGVGFKGFPQYINAFGGPTAVLYFSRCSATAGFPSTSDTRSEPPRTAAPTRCPRLSP